MFRQDGAYPGGNSRLVRTGNSDQYYMVHAAGPALSKNAILPVCGKSWEAGFLLSQQRRDQLAIYLTASLRYFKASYAQSANVIVSRFNGAKTWMHLR